MRMLLLLIALLPGLAAAQGATAPSPTPTPTPPKNQVYKWVDDKGVIHYTDKAPTEGATPAKLPPLQTYKGGTNPDLHKFDKGTPGKAPAAAEAQLQLVTPAKEETFRSAERTVPVAVLVTPPLTPGQQIVFMLDGKATEPTTDTSYAFTEVDRGAHTVSASLVDASGNELAHSDSVTFYMMPPIVKRK